jgi:hypothetical protein
MIQRYWTTFVDGFHGLDPAPEGKGNWVKFADHEAERERLVGLLREWQDTFHADGCYAGDLERPKRKCDLCKRTDAALAKENQNG